MHLGALHHVQGGLLYLARNSLVLLVYQFSVGEAVIETILRRNAVIGHRLHCVGTGLDRLVDEIAQHVALLDNIDRFSVLVHDAVLVGDRQR